MSIDQMINQVRQDAGGLTIRTPADVYTAMEALRGAPQELFYALALDGRCRIIGAPVLVSVGLVDWSPVHAREAFAEIIVRRAKEVVIVHNHPSGDPTPSVEDLDLTERMLEAGRILGIPVRDHIVIGQGRCWSMLAEKPAAPQYKYHRLIAAMMPVWRARAREAL